MLYDALAAAVDVYPASCAGRDTLINWAFDLKWFWKRKKKTSWLTAYAHTASVGSQAAELGKSGIILLVLMQSRGSAADVAVRPQGPVGAENGKKNSNIWNDYQGETNLWVQGKIGCNHVRLCDTGSLMCF